MKNLSKTTLMTFLILSLSSCDLAQRIEKRAAQINRYEDTALLLAKENRDLKAEINRLKFEIESLDSKNNYLKIKLEKQVSEFNKAKGARTIASVHPKPAPRAAVDPKNDLVKFDVYKWTPNQILAMAEKEFEAKNFERSAQFFNVFYTNFPGHKKVDDNFLFQAGVAAYESGKHPDWVLTNMEKLVREYPASPFYRGAKLWMALTYLNQGKEDHFFTIVEEFRKKYKNTSEWKILSKHYEKIVQNYKKN